LAPACSMAILLLPLTVLRAETITIQTNDTLSEIISRYYPGHPDRRALMQAILARNPDAFRGNINNLIVGRTLTLPPPDYTPVSPESRQALEQVQLQQQLQDMAQQKQGLEDTLQNTRSQLQAQRDELQQTRSRMEQEQQALKARNDELQQESASLRETLSALQQSRSRMEQQVETLRTDKGQLESGGNDLQLQLSALQDQLQLLEGDKKLQTEQVSKLEQDNATLANVRTQLEARLDKLEQDNERLTNENGDLQVQLGQSQQTLDDFNSQAANLRTQLAELNTRNAALQNDLQLSKLQQQDEVEINPGPSRFTTLWPWLLALVLLPLAWLLGRRSRPEPKAIPAPAQPKPESPPPQATTRIPPPPPPAHSATVPVEPVTATVSTDQWTHHERAGKATPEPVARSETVPAPSTASPATPGHPDAALKLAIARAYLDLRNADAAQDILQDVLTEGGSRQQQEAREILSFIN
ncbi:MAG: hypothetical protein KDI15_02335, partial [Thiothrix sp.]|nr:hypothetical protein [Thiothrix sp.]